MNSKIEARIEAVKLALNVEGVTSENIIDVSTKIADFVIGDSNLPEKDPAEDMQKRMMDIMTDAYKRLPITPDKNSSPTETPASNG